MNCIVLLNLQVICYCLRVFPGLIHGSAASGSCRNEMAGIFRHKSILQKRGVPYT
jgi:hypothetical protein